MSNNLAERYNAARDRWEQETLHLSSSTAMMENASFQEILGMGKVVIPLIIQDLVKEDSWIMMALPKLTSERPRRQPELGNLRDMVESWLEWAMERGYL